MVTKKTPARAKKVTVKVASRSVRTAPPATVEAALVVAQPPAAKQKLVRDSFTIPKREYEVLVELKGRLVTLARPTKKSELLRAGIASLAALSDARLLAVVKAVPSLKTGRPTASMGKGSKAAVKKA